MAKQNPIIVLQRFDNIIDANIIKSKLDAYGIPCFLSEEHVTHLTTSLLSGGVRLHIFEQDRQQVIQLLAEETLHKSEEEDLIRCPNCRSRRVIHSQDERFVSARVLKFIFNLSKAHYCLDCQTEFN